MGAADAAAVKTSPIAAAIKPDMRPAANRRLTLARMCSSRRSACATFLATLPPVRGMFQSLLRYSRETVRGPAENVQRILYKIDRRNK
jgi:hypothetical protein